MLVQQKVFQKILTWRIFMCAVRKNKLYCACENFKQCLPERRYMNSTFLQIWKCFHFFKSQVAQCIWTRTEEGIVLSETSLSSKCFSEFLLKTLSLGLHDKKNWGIFIVENTEKRNKVFHMRPRYCGGPNMSHQATWVTPPTWSQICIHVIA